MKQIIRKCLKRYGYDITRYNQGERSISTAPDLSDEEKEIYGAIAPYTMTSIERVISVIQATKYIVENHIEGDIVECGVWRGGSMMAVAQVLKRIGDTKRKLYLYDTFAGMSPPTEQDKQYDNVSAGKLLEESQVNTGVWCYADKQDVMRNLLSTGYPEENILLVEGKVEDTIPGTLPAKIALLRLDTDWYESTRHELTHLYPRLTKNGVLIIDDYGHWQGAKKAVDEYFVQLPVKPFLQRIDYTARSTVKIEEGT